MINLMLNDWQRIWKRRKTMISLLIFAAIVGLDSLFLNMQQMGAFDSVSGVPLTAENIPLFLLKEVSFFLSLIIGPMLIIDSFNGEAHSGQLRLVLIRPISFGKLFAAKWLNLSILLTLFLAVTFAIGVIAGYAFKPSLDWQVFRNPEQTYDQAGAFLYCLKAYGFFLLILLAQLSVMALLCFLLPNPVLCYLGWIGVAVGSLYATDALSFLLYGIGSVFDWLEESGPAVRLVPVIICMGIGFAVTMVGWRRRNWVN
ncbi:ABC transporter permease [Paenibacillus sp. CC-CFT747]|nr:ABC transporter permease [Paenibacillus sp. CC-CFT747]